MICKQFLLGCCRPLDTHSAGFIAKSVRLDALKCFALRIAVEHAADPAMPPLSEEALKGRVINADGECRRSLLLLAQFLSHMAKRKLVRNVVQCRPHVGDCIAHHR